MSLGVAAQEPLQDGDGVRRPRNHRSMLQIAIVCSSCAEETEVVVENLDDVAREVCGCGYSYVVLSVAEFEPVHGKGGQLIELRPRRDDLKRAA